MVLSISKLEKLLAVKGFLPRRFFIIHGLCAYVEVMSIRNADTFILSIPSKYKLRCDEGYKIRPIDMGEKDKEVTNEYAGSPDNIHLEKAYTEVDIAMTPTRFDDDDDGNVASRLEEAYKRAIMLQDISREDVTQVRDIFRQLKRMRYCVQGIRYKIAIFWKHYLCVVDRDASIECFYIKRFSGVDKRKFLIVCDLELFYERMDHLEKDVARIRQGIYQVLDKNQSTHTKNINRMLAERNEVLKNSEEVQARKLLYQKHIENFESLLDRTNESEKACLDKIYSLDESGMNETAKFHQKAKLETDLRQITQTKQDIVKNLMKLKEGLEDMALSTDKILFDNSVMFDQILRNFGYLEKLIE